MSRYFADVFADAKRDNVQWQVYEGDLWAYNYMSKPGAFWTGYFSTGPHIKKQIRDYGDYVQSATQLIGTSPISVAEESLLLGQDELLETLSIM